MAKTKREYILATCFISGAAAILSLVSLGTQNWVVADGPWTVADLTGTNTIHYGLFEGTFRQQLVSYPVTFQISMTCRLGLNICAMLCGQDNAARYTQLDNLYNNRNTSFENCPRVTTAYVANNFRTYNSYSNRVGTSALSSSSDERRFINSGVWVSVVFFLCVSAVFGLVSSGLAIYNTASNPIEVYFSVYGLYIYNTVAFVTILITILLWGIMFAQTIIHDVGIYYTLVGMIDTNNRANLGYSYWINLVSLFCYATSIGLLYFRHYLISKEPEVNVHIEDNADPGLYLY